MIYSHELSRLLLERFRVFTCNLSVSLMPVIYIKQATLDAEI